MKICGCTLWESAVDTFCVYSSGTSVFEILIITWLFFTFGWLWKCLSPSFASWVVFFHKNWQRICRKFVDTLLCSLDRFKLVKFVANISISNVSTVMSWLLCQFTGLQLHLCNIGGYISKSIPIWNFGEPSTASFRAFAHESVLKCYVYIIDCLFKVLLIFMVEAVCKLMLALICGWSFYLSKFCCVIFTLWLDWP